MQTILGAGGAIGRELARSLPTYTDKIRLVSRNPQAVNEGDELLVADLTNPEETKKAVEGSEVIYLTAGLKYDIRVWQDTWPVIMQNVIDAAKNHQAKVVFFDNIYMYDPASIGSMTETNPINPKSRKGKVRAQISQMLMKSVENGDIQALIARAADFYGPSIKDVSILTETIIKPLSDGKKANILGSVDHVHSFTFTPDAGKATAMLGNTPDAFNQVWHLPTSSEKLTIKDFIEMIAGYFEVKPKYQVAGRTLTKVLGLFVPIMREMHEMIYQYESDYFFDSEKFNGRFDFKPVSYEDGIKQVLTADYGKSF
jgi:nucleoside-diphosphate-sugar epimerase